MVVNTLWRTFQGPFLALDELRVGRSFLLLEMTASDELLVAEVMLREVRNDGQAVDLAMFITYSTDGQALPPGDTVERHVGLDKCEKAYWTLVKIHYY